MIDAGANESGDRIEHDVADVDREQLPRTLQDLADFIDMTREVTSRTREAYDADITLRLAGEAIVSKVGQSAAFLKTTSRQIPRCPGGASEVPEI